jgi:hypothetical protein
MARLGAFIRDPVERRRLLRLAMKDIGRVSCGAGTFPLRFGRIEVAFEPGRRKDLEVNGGEGED